MERATKMTAKIKVGIKPARLSKGILTAPPPIPNIPLINPAKRLIQM